MTFTLLKPSRLVRCFSVSQRARWVVLRETPIWLAFQLRPVRRLFPAAPAAEAGLQAERHQSLQRRTSFQKAKRWKEALLNSLLLVLPGFAGVQLPQRERFPTTTRTKNSVRQDARLRMTRLPPAPALARRPAQLNKPTYATARLTAVAIRPLRFVSPHSPDLPGKWNEYIYRQVLKSRYRIHLLYKAAATSDGSVVWASGAVAGQFVRQAAGVQRSRQVADRRS